MIKHILRPQAIKPAGNKAKLIEEFFGVVNSNSSAISIARMKSPEGWIEPGQKPEFDEYTIVLRGKLKVETKSGTIEVSEDEAIHVTSGEWVKYSTPYSGGAEYIAVCMPAFTNESVNRDK